MEHYMNDLSRSLSVPGRETQPAADAAARRDPLSGDGRDAETPIGIDPAHAELPRTDTPRTDTVHTDASHTDASRTDAPRAESSRRPPPVTPTGLPKLRPGIVLANRWEILSSL